MTSPLSARGIATLAAGLLTSGLLVASPHATAATPQPRADGLTQATAESQTSEPQPWQQYNYAPSDRTLHPESVFTTHGTVDRPAGAITGGSTRLQGHGSYVTYDFGKEVGGLTSLHFDGASDPDQRVGLAFSESSLYVGTDSDASNGGGGPDGAIYADASGSYTVPQDKLRGGFRYLTLFLAGDGWADIDDVTLHFTAAPLMSDLRDYPNYFYSSDPLLNRIWYAGAYTVQMDTIDPDTGRVWGPPATGWDNGATVGVGDSVLVDGAKRDRTVWPGDLGIAVPTAFVSTDDMVSTRNALTTLYDHQRDSGELPYAGPEVNFYGSDTYHMWTLVGTANYYLYTGDDAWLQREWDNYTRAMDYIVGKIDDRGLLDVTGAADWARSGQGGENIEANAILYRALTTGAALARAQHATEKSATWSDLAARLKHAVNDTLWDADAGLYRDNPSSDLHPQDGNSLAVWFGLVDSRAKAESISTELTDNWNTYGATTPEKGGNIGTFPGSMEVQAHFQAGDDRTGLALIRREWGYMLDSPLGTRSTFWEGYRADGSFDYGGSYMSNAHGWATGPTSALTFYVLGTEPDTAAGDYHFVPHPGGLGFAQGRLTLPQGAVDASWKHDTDRHRFTEHLSAPAGTTGQVGVPTFGRRVVVSVNGELAWNGTRAMAYDAHTDGRYVYLEGLTGGDYTVTSHPAAPPVRSLTAHAAPDTATLHPGDRQTYTVTVTGRSPNPIHGTVTAEAPADWSVAPAEASFQLPGGDGPHSTQVSFRVSAPESAAPGDHTLYFTARAPAVPASTTIATAHVPRPLQLVKAWEFDQPGDAQGWQAANDLTSPVVTGSQLHTTATGADPYLVLGDPLQVDAHDGVVVEVVMTTSTDSGGQVFYTTQASPYFSESKSITFAVHGGAAQTYRLTLPPQENVITGLRLDPLRQPGEIGIDAIRIYTGGS